MWPLSAKHDYNVSSSNLAERNVLVVGRQTCGISFESLQGALFEQSLEKLPSVDAKANVAKCSFRAEFEHADATSPLLPKCAAQNVCETKHASLVKALRRDHNSAASSEQSCLSRRKLRRDGRTRPLAGPNSGGIAPKLVESESVLAQVGPIWADRPKPVQLGPNMRWRRPELTRHGQHMAEMRPLPDSIPQTSAKAQIGAMSPGCGPSLPEFGLHARNSGEPCPGKMTTRRSARSDDFGP